MESLDGGVFVHRRRDFFEYGFGRVWLNPQLQSSPSHEHKKLDYRPTGLDIAPQKTGLSPTGLDIAPWIRHWISALD